MDAFAVTHTLDGETYWDRIFGTRDEANDYINESIIVLQESDMDVGEFHLYEMVNK